MAAFKASQRGDPHNWNSLDNYRFLHEKYLGEHPLVKPVGWTFALETTKQPQAPYDLITF